MDYEGINPLYKKLEYADEITIYKITKDPDLNVYMRDSQGFSALMLAVINDKKLIKELLINRYLRDNMVIQISNELYELMLRNR